ncbi:CidA/LrgA family protein [Natronospora cellulosivora (SeqCode)]
MKFIKGLFLIFLLLFIGELIVSVTSLPIPGNIIGMILLFFSLVFKIIELEDVVPAGDLLLEHLMLYFIPVSIGILAYRELLMEGIISFGIIVVLAYFILYFIIAKMIDLFVCIFEKRS